MTLSHVASNLGAYMRHRVAAVLERLSVVRRCCEQRPAMASPNVRRANAAHRTTTTPSPLSTLLLPAAACTPCTPSPAATCRLTVRSWHSAQRPAPAYSCDWCSSSSNSQRALFESRQESTNVRRLRRALPARTFQQCAHETFAPCHLSPPQPASLGRLPRNPTAQARMTRYCRQHTHTREDTGIRVCIS